MNKTKLIMLCMSVVILSLVGCTSAAPQQIADKPEISQKEASEDKNESEGVDFDAENDDNSPSAEEKTTSDDLLDAFIRGEIAAEGNYEGKDSFYLSDLENNDEEWLQYSVGDRIDADNDGEEELFLNGPYGGMLLDARDGKVVILSEGEGTAGVLSIARYGGAFWVVHADTSHSGREIYVLDKYNETGEITDSTTLSAEYWDNPDDQYDENSIFTFHDKPISMSEFEKLWAELFDWAEPKKDDHSEDYIFPDSADRLLTAGDLLGLSDEDLRRGRNEIVARHGRTFDDPELQEYFDSKPWYEGTIAADDFNKNVKLNDIEQANMDFIKDHETTRSSSNYFEHGEYQIGGVHFENDKGDAYSQPLIVKVQGDTIAISGSYYYIKGYDKDVFFNGRRSSDPITLKLSPDIKCGHAEEEETYYVTKDQFFDSLSRITIQLHLKVKDGVVIQAIDSP